ncbi:hypothetical protein DPMN_025607 [Dreissena polymorpha]|uniref:Uncharacterized protein n=1 Tax=Dreissena polymorpha TaxID=45954 RepID=A0A9D4RDH1_DREPO|nr:hypothetical protein DPMN_025607 [Dreissena polymorpha]
MTVWAPAGDSQSQTVTDSLRYRLGICRRLPVSHRRCQKITQTIWASSGHFQTVYDGATTVWHLQHTPRQSTTVLDNLTVSLGACRGLPAILRRCQTVPTPYGHLQETPRQSATVSRLSGHLKKTPRPSQIILIIATISCYIYLYIYI